MTREEIITKNLLTASESIVRIIRRIKHFKNRDYPLTAVFDSEKVLYALCGLESKVALDISQVELKEKYGLK